MVTDHSKAPELIVEKWLNTDETLSLESLKGRVVALFTFQMLCPGCVIHSIPQARKVHAYFEATDLAVIGLHTVFEHHSAMSEVSLKAFVHEYKLDFPIAIDKPFPDPEIQIPQTMSRYQTQGTPTLLLIDRNGFLRTHHMGHLDDLIVGAQIMKLIAE